MVKKVKFIHCEQGAIIEVESSSIVYTRCIGEGTVIGPFCYIGHRVVIGKNVKIIGHCSIGNPGQHPARPEDKGGLIYIGDGTEIREFVTINTPLFTQATVVGPDCYLMANSHVGHDCLLGKHVVLSMAKLAGHTVVGDYTYFGLNASTHQFANIGSYCMIGANSFFKGSSPDGLTWGGVPARPLKVNTVGLDRHASPEKRAEIEKEAFNFLLKSRE